MIYNFKNDTLFFNRYYVFQNKIMCSKFKRLILLKRL